jgi:flavin reductase (DIM6/NTAB) family NADH-FMN oxidoreductase RutF
MLAPAVDHEPIEASSLPTREAYQLMIDLVSPRPIAWVSTVDVEGRRNLAPFSYYQAVCSHPPMIVLSISWHSDGTPKDTLRNILEVGTFVVNHTRRAHAEVMNLTSGEYAPEIDEWDVVERAASGMLTAVPSRIAAAPRIGQAMAALECRLVQAIPLGEGRAGRPSSTLVLAEVALFWLERTLVQRDERGRLRPLDPARLASLGRMGGIAYTDTEGRFEMARPAIGRARPTDAKQGNGA